MLWRPTLTIPGSVSASVFEDPCPFDAHCDWPAQKIVALNGHNLTRASGAPVLDAHCDWQAQEIVGLKRLNLTRA